uniref:Uncharacterized protein n=1 Tax=Ananas comosus var. bracteatus TaxID=296719 RepID=A0A6V7QDJ6_ANACO|nr:unnamed protein product [Ananas comosus var. bracteatus]
MPAKNGVRSRRRPKDREHHPVRGSQRIERSESGARFAQRMRRAGFSGVLFDEETARGVRVLLSEHASGWGMKREEDMLVLTWKGHSSVFTSAWVPKVIS